MKAFQQYKSKMDLYYTLITCMDFDQQHFRLSLNFFRKSLFYLIKVSVFCFFSFIFLLLFFISFRFFVCFIFTGVRTITPEKNCPPPRLGLGFELALELGLGLGRQFSSGAIVLEPFLPVKNKEIFCMPTKC